jgi:pyruvate formate lyase activating enzyme
MGISLSELIFDIQRGALHDGPGIRTVVFLKGCPLNCQWCHNPEARSFEAQLFWYADRCVHCGACADACQYDVHVFENGIHSVDFERCILSAECVEVCQREALKIIGTETSVLGVLHEVLSDQAYYDNSGGGITLSGGEPMSHPEFILELLTQCKQNGVHTCIQTAGSVARERFEKVLPMVDHFLFDYKLSNPEDHKRYTGVTNQLILENLDYLYHSEATITLRCPIIPGVNDTNEHFRAIHELSLKYPNLAGIELLPYHDMGKSKAQSIGLDIPFEELKTTPKEMTENWLSTLKRLGTAKATIG